MGADLSPCPSYTYTHTCISQALGFSVVLLGSVFLPLPPRPERHLHHLFPRERLGESTAQDVIGDERGLSVQCTDALGLKDVCLDLKCPKVRRCHSVVQRPASRTGQGKGMGQCRDQSLPNSPPGSRASSHGLATAL